MLRVTNEMGRRFTARNSWIAAWAAGASMMLAALLLTAPPAVAQTSRIATHTTIASQAQVSNGRTVLIYSASVQGEDGSPASGAVQLEENGKTLAASALDSTGNAEIRADGLSGDHSLRAVYSGDTLHAASQSDSLTVHADTTATPGFTLTIAPSTITVAAPGDAGSLVATITPHDGFTGFVSMSCSGPGGTSSTTGGSSLPVGVTCLFTPANVEVSSTAAVSAQMVLQTTTGQQTVAARGPAHESKPQPESTDHHPLVLAFLLPGAIGVALLGRKRKQWRRAGWLIALALVGTFSMTACNPRYSYLKHPPTFTGTPTGTFPLLVTAQTSNGVTASTQSVSLTLTVQ